MSRLYYCKLAIYLCVSFFCTENAAAQLSFAKSKLFRTTQPHAKLIEPQITQKNNNEINKIPQAGDFYVHIQYEDVPEYSQDALSVIGKNYSLNEYTFGEDYDLFLSEGSYDFVVSFSAPDYFHEVWVIREAIEITSDTTLIFSPLEATETISAKFINPKGDYFKFYQIGITEEGDYELFEEGNFQWELFSYFITLDGIPIAQCQEEIDAIGGDYYDGEFTPWYWDFNTIYISPISQRFKITFVENIIDVDMQQHVIRYETEGTNQSLCVNDPDNYVTYSETIQRSPLGSIDYNSYGIRTMNIFKSENRPIFGVEINYDLPATNDDNTKAIIKQSACLGKSDFYDTQIKSVAIDHYDTIIKYINIPWRDEPQKITEFVPNYIFGSPAIIDGQTIVYANTGYSNTNLFHKDQKGNYVYRTHPAFTYESSKRMGIYGNNVPICSFMATNYDLGYPGNTKASFWKPQYIGRLGESRESDFGSLFVSIKFDGNEVCNSYAQLDSLTEAWVNENHSTGNWDATFINNNVIVDDIPGKNITHITTNDSWNDWTAPTLQMLDFQNQDGVMTDHFENAADGFVQIAAGDFEFDIDGLYFTCQDVEIKVEYSTNGTENWQDLTSIEEIPEYYQMPVFGYFYRGSLAEITEISENGWYDMRITLTDANGNKQEQILSPAFKVENSAISIGLKQIDHNNAIIYNLQGHKISNDKMNSGVYVINGKKVAVM